MPESKGAEGDSVSSPSSPAPSPIVKKTASEERGKKRKAKSGMKAKAKPKKAMEVLSIKKKR